jgi:hypothetical protein
MGTKLIAKNVQTHPINLTAQTSNHGASEITKHRTNTAATEAFRKDASSLYDFAALDGLRVVACLSVICFHSLLYWGTLLDINEGEKVSRLFETE